MFTDLEYQGTPSRASQQSLRLLHTLLYRRLTKLQGCAQRISGTSRCFFELSGATNSTIGSYQIDYVNLRPNRATEWDSTPKRCSKLTLPITTTYKLSQVKEAIEHSQRGGKVRLDFNFSIRKRRPERRQAMSYSISTLLRAVGTQRRSPCGSWWRAACPLPAESSEPAERSRGPGRCEREP